MKLLERQVQHDEKHRQYYRKPPVKIPIQHKFELLLNLKKKKKEEEENKENYRFDWANALNIF